MTEKYVMSESRIPDGILHDQVLDIPNTRPCHIKQGGILYCNLFAVPEGILPSEQTVINYQIRTFLQGRLTICESTIGNLRILLPIQCSFACQQFLINFFHLFPSLFIQLFIIVTESNKERKPKYLQNFVNIGQLRSHFYN